MLKVLLKKQMTEVFRGYFYNRKTNKARSKANQIVLFSLFAFLMVGVLGGSFTAVALGVCFGLTSAGMGWLYFVLMSSIAIVLGAFGSVFNTYSGLYLPKDNDLLLSMPIPVRTIIVSRLLNVYLLGAMYSGVVMLPTLIVYWVIVGAAIQNVICGIVLFLIITIIVLILSCLLGWIVAKISLKHNDHRADTLLPARLDRRQNQLEAEKQELYRRADCARMYRRLLFYLFQGADMDQGACRQRRGLRN